jgi:gamma-glutamylcyclotransferase (GGCT)/AIG2-like uncharacterized protein YtfP
MKLFVYGKLQSTKSKNWLLPFSKNKKHRLYGYRLYLLPKGTAGLVVGDKNDYVKGEIREVKWATGLLGKLLLFILDLNEGTFCNTYKRVKVKDMWVYLYVVKGSFKGIKIHKWSENMSYK